MLSPVCLWGMCGLEVLASVVLDCVTYVFFCISVLSDLYIIVYALYIIVLSALGVNGSAGSMLHFSNQLELNRL